jgi:hypothetical protein
MAHHRGPFLSFLCAVRDSAVNQDFYEIVMVPLRTSVEIGIAVGIEIDHCFVAELLGPAQPASAG